MNVCLNGGTKKPDSKTKVNQKERKFKIALLNYHYEKVFFHSCLFQIYKFNTLEGSVRTFTGNLSNNTSSIAIKQLKLTLSNKHSLSFHSIVFQNTIKTISHCQSQTATAHNNPSPEKFAKIYQN